jgi:hypothetical protein
MSFLSGRDIIWINIKHSPKGVMLLYSFENERLMGSLSGYLEASYIADTAMLGFLYGTI